MNSNNSLTLSLTEDGSATIYNNEKKEHFHSIHGAVQESRHVFIEAGLKYALREKSKVSILEIGFGTGLNALLTLDELISRNSIYESSSDKVIQADYTGIEPNPIGEVMVNSLNYPDFLKIKNLKNCFLEMHSPGKNAFEPVFKYFEFRKLIMDFQDYEIEDLKYDLVYFDAFSPVAEPTLWIKEIFEKIWSCMSDQSIIVTYCSKGSVRRLMQECGFITERLPGPPGKHEMLRGNKTID